MLFHAMLDTDSLPVPQAERVSAFANALVLLDSIDRDLAIALVTRALAAATTGSFEVIADFLASGRARHLGEAIADEMSEGTPLRVAVPMTLAPHLEWLIDEDTSRDTGIPVGLPYIAG